MRHASLGHALLAALLGLVSAGVQAAAPAKGMPPVPVPVADYDFLGWLGDARGNGPLLTQSGSGSAAYVIKSADGSTRQVLAVPAGSGLRLDSGPLLARNAYTIAMLVSLSSTGSYAKLVDTNNLGGDAGLYAVSNRINYYTAGNSPGANFPDDALRQLVATRAADGSYVLYVDGVQQFSFADPDNNQQSEITAKRVLHFLRDDNGTGNGEDSDAVVHRIRLFDRPLSAAEAAALEADRGILISVFRSGGFEGSP